MAASLFLLLSVLLGVINAGRLVYVEKPAGAGPSFVADLASAYDLRGDYGNFVLLADSPVSIARVVFGDFDTDLRSYFVAEYVIAGSKAESVIFRNFTNVAVKDKFVFAIPKDMEDQFIGAAPHGLEIVPVPDSRLPAPSQGYKFTVLAAPDPNIQSLIKQVSSDDLYNFVTYLTGEAPTSNIMTRQAQSADAVYAQEYLQAQFTQFGFVVSTQAFRAGYSSNVVATMKGQLDATKLVLVTAHYDSRGPSLSSPTARAPGANDNGSGTGALLQIAKLISDNKLSFNYTVILIAFSGEEQGLYGSAYAAQQFKAQGADIIAVLNADMIAYRDPDEAPQLAFASRSSTSALNQQLAAIAQLYVTGLAVGTTSACCTDHASFYNQGYNAASFFERNGNIADPQYHKAGDLVNRVGYDITGQYPLIVQAEFASLLTIAEYRL